MREFHLRLQWSTTVSNLDRWLIESLGFQGASCHSSNCSVSTFFYPCFSDRCTKDFLSCAASSKNSRHHKLPIVGRHQKPWWNIKAGHCFEHGPMIDRKSWIPRCFLSLVELQCFHILLPVFLAIGAQRTSYRVQHPARIPGMTFCP